LQRSAVADRRAYPDSFLHLAGHATARQRAQAMSGKHQTHLSVRQLSIHAGQQTLVDNITLHIPAGGVLTLLGESGSGKSLLAQAIMGNLPASLRCTGAVDIGAQQFDAADLRARRRLWGRTLSLLPQ